MLWNFAGYVVGRPRARHLSGQTSVLTAICLIRDHIHMWLYHLRPHLLETIATSPVTLRWMCDSPRTECARRTTIIEWLRRMISIVTCCLGAKLYAHAARAFPIATRPQPFEIISILRHVKKAVLIYCASHFYDLPFTFLWKTWSFARWLFIWSFARLRPSVSRGDSRWVVNALALQKTAEARKLFILRVWKGVLHLWHAIWTKSKNYMFCVPTRFLYRSATMVSVFNWKLKHEKKMLFCVDRKYHRRKSNFVAFQKRNAAMYEQKVWRVISAIWFSFAIWFSPVIVSTNAKRHFFFSRISFSS